MADSLMIDYYKRPFYELHEQLHKKTPMIQWYLHERGLFWNKIEFNTYDYSSAIPILNAYFAQIENRIQQTIEKKSFLYWIHVYRRIALGKPVSNCSKLDITRTRAIMEIAFQKYGKPGFCNHIGTTRKVGVEKVLNGILLKPEYELERIALKNSKDSLVLTEFGVEELMEVYELEKLCYEINLINKAIRLLGKGCELYYSEKREWYSFKCSNDIQILIDNYDERLDSNGITSSYLGVYYSDETNEVSDCCLFPVYNTRGDSFDIYKDLIQSFYNDTLSVLCNNKPNFVIYTFNILSYYRAHKDVSDSFFSTNKVSFEAVMIVLRYLYYEVFSKVDKIEWFVDLVSRGYRLFRKKELINVLSSMRNSLASEFGVQRDVVKKNDINKALSFISFNVKKQGLLDLHYCSLYYPLIEFDDFYLIVFVWVYRFFLTLFFKFK